MDLFDWIGFIVTPILLVFFAVFYQKLYILINSPEISQKEQPPVQDLTNSNLKGTGEAHKTEFGINSIILKLIPVGMFLLIIVGLMFIPFDSTSIFFSNSVNIFLIFGILLSFPLIGMFTALLSEHFTKIQAAKEISAKVIHYYFPMILSVLSLLIMIFLKEGTNSIVSFESLIRFQSNGIIHIGTVDVPGDFIFQNPFSFLAYISAFIGLYRQTNLDAQPKQSLRAWNPYESFQIHNPKIFNLAQASHFLIFILLIIPLFIGSLWIGEMDLMNIVVQLLFALVVVISMGMFARGKPRTIIDRKIEAFVRTPLFFAILAIGWAVAISFY